jgi:hypothetical protein
VINRAHVDELKVLVRFSRQLEKGDSRLTKYLLGDSIAPLGRE